VIVRLMAPCGVPALVAIVICAISEYVRRRAPSSPTQAPA
jgi:hypothetical protein